MLPAVARRALALAIGASSLALVSAPAHPQGQTGPVTVVVEVALTPGTTPAEALAALADMRALMKRQPGYLSEEFLQNLNPENVPRFVHVSRWASMAYWAALFGAPAFNRFSAHGNTHYTVSASAFVPAD